MAVGGAAYLVSKAITSARVVAFPEMGMEAIYEFEVKDMPVTVAVDCTGTSVHETGRKSGRREDSRAGHHRCLIRFTGTTTRPLAQTLPVTGPCSLPGCAPIRT